MQALLITDNAEDGNFLGFILRHAGLSVLSRQDFPVAEAAFLEQPVDLVLVSAQTQAHLIEQVTAVRAVTQAPIFLLVDHPGEGLHCDLLDAGADLVFSRPTSPRILSRYIRLLANQTGSVPTSVLTEISTANVTLDPKDRTVTAVSGTPQHLTQLEFRLLYMFMTNVGQIIPTETIVERVWGYEGAGNKELVRGLIRRLRLKIEDNANKPQLIRNLPGVGYGFFETP